MSKSQRKPNPTLSSLMEKFARNDVIAELEKEYQVSGGVMLSLSLIDDNHTVRKARPSKQESERFAAALKDRGLWNPLLVRPYQGRYELILGRKRYYGARIVGLKEVPCVISEASDEETLLMLLADVRDQREGSVLEMALIYQALISEYGYSQATLARLSHASRSQITNIIRLLKLPEPVIDELAKGRLTYGHARALIPLSYNDCLDVSEAVIRNSYSVRETEELCRRVLFPGQREDDLRATAIKIGADSIEKKEKSLTIFFPTKGALETFLAKISEKKN